MLALKRKGRYGLVFIDGHSDFRHLGNSKSIGAAAGEYLAHATQFGVLSTQRREEIIKSEDTGPWEPGDEFSVTYMGINTTGFAVKSYLHLTQMTDPQSFIQILLNHKWLYICTLMVKLVIKRTRCNQRMKK